MKPSFCYLIAFLFHVSASVATTHSVPLFSKPQLIDSQEEDAMRTVYKVSAFAMSDLQQGTRDDELKQILSSTGLFTIRIPISTHSHLSSVHDPNIQTSHKLLSRICQCADSFPNMKGGDVNLLKDGLTIRHTLATATMGLERPMPLPEQELNNSCGSNASNDLEALRDYVSFAVSDAFLPALDRLLQNNGRTNQGVGDSPPPLSSKPLLVKENGDAYQTITSIVEDAVHLEHFHVYTKQDTSNNRKKNSSTDPFQPYSQEDPFSLQWHTDAGLFLAYVPAINCHPHEDEVDASFYIQDRSTLLEPHTPKHLLVQYPTSNSNEILVNIMMGMGMEQWIDTQVQIKATVHAVKMDSGSHRAWFGAMYLVHGDALIQKNQTFSGLKRTSFSHTISRTFGNSNVHDHQEEAILIGCGAGTVVDENAVTVDLHSESYNQLSISRRRLQHVGGPDDCNNDSNFFCWMSCLEVDGNSVSTQAHLQNGEALYCLNPAILAETNDVGYAVEVCSDPLTGIAGGIMDERCGNYWLPKVEGIQSHSDLYVNQFTPKYCYGKTAMYMQGFSWEGTTCLVYLFSSWIITSRAALILSCIGTIAFGIFTEFVIRKRRTVLKQIADSRRRLVMSAFLYGCQLTLGYMLMLIVMSYSGPLVLSVITGLVSGHMIWSYTEAVANNKARNHTIFLEGSTPCCQNVVEEEFAEDKSNNSDERTAERTCGCV